MGEPLVAVMVLALMVGAWWLPGWLVRRESAAYDRGVMAGGDAMRHATGVLRFDNVAGAVVRIEDQPPCQVGDCDTFAMDCGGKAVTIEVRAR